MALKIGRVSLRDQVSMNEVSRRVVTDQYGPLGDAQPGETTRSTQGWRYRGIETGASLATTMADFERERERRGSVYVQGNGDVSEGWYELEAPIYAKESGGPAYRKWEAILWKSPRPFVVRQAEDDNITGADTAELDASEEEKVVYTPTTSDVVVLQPRTASGAEKVNLPYGDWGIIVRAYQVTNSSAKFRGRTTDIAGATLVDGSQVAIGAAATWKDIDLGTFSVAKADHKANWFEVLVQGVVSELGDVWIDHVRIVPR